MPSTIHLHRVLAAKPEKVYRAFVEPDAIASWLPPFGFLCTVHELEAKVGGKHRMSFRNFTTGNSHSFGGSYVEVVPGQKLVYTDKFDDPNLPGEMKVTVTFKAVSCGTEMTRGAVLPRLARIFAKARKARGARDQRVRAPRGGGACKRGRACATTRFVVLRASSCCTLWLSGPWGTGLSEPACLIGLTSI
jgi:uncharacterized protein YndB with AHSA1/START domain